MEQQQVASCCWYFQEKAQHVMATIPATHNLIEAFFISRVLQGNLADNPRFITIVGNSKDHQNNGKGG